MTPAMRVRLLGEFQIDHSGAPLAGLSSGRLQSLLAYLLIHRGAPLSRAHVAFQFWSDSSESQAQANLRYFLHQLRRALPDAGQYLHADKTSLQWRADAPYTLDVAEFERALAQARGAADAEAARALEQAIALYGGDLLPSCYDDWIVPERERLRDLLLEALERLSVLHEQHGDYARAIACQQRLLRQDPLREATYRHLMRLHALNGDPVDLARTYQTCVTVLQRELAVEPGAATREEYERLARQAARASPPLRAASQAPERIAARLPVLLTSFIGRERELSEVKQLLQTTRLLTLTGAGGSGKTRLALAAAAELSQARALADGVCWVELAPLADPALVPKAIATALGVGEQPNRTLIEALCDALAPQQRLLVLDNCEHVVEICAQLARSMLSAAPRLRIVVTSREPLNIAGETTWVVPSLRLPEPSTDAKTGSDIREIAQSEAVQLFVERAGSTLPTFKLTQRNAGAIADICRRLDGIPLAIELAAARVKVLSVEQIATRLDDRFNLLSGGHRDTLPQHQSLRAAIDWSYQLLSAPERSLLQRLAVFAGGCTLDAAETVCAFDGPLDVLNGLALLVDKSLLEQTLLDGEPRFRMLETIQAYGRERLSSSEEAAALLRAHAEYYHRLALEAEPHFFDADQQVWLSRIDRERANIRAALEWSRATYDRNPGAGAESLTLGLHLAALLWRFWKARGYVTEGRQWLDALLARSGALHSYEKAFAIHTAGNLANDQGDIRRARELYEACLTLSKELPHRHFIAHMNLNLGNIAVTEAEYDRAERLYSEALPYYREINWGWGVAAALLNLANIARAQGKYDRARSLYDEALTLNRQSGDKERIALTLANLGRLAEDMAQYEEATRLYEESFALYEQLGDRLGIPYARRNLGRMAQRGGDGARALALFEESLAQFRQTGDRRGTALALGSLGNHAGLRGDNVQALALYRESLSLFRDASDKLGILGSLEAVADVSAAQHDPERAARLFGAADALRQAIGTPISPSEQERHEQRVREVGAALGADAFAAAWAAGRSLNLEQAIAEALVMPEAEASRTAMVYPTATERSLTD